MKRSIHDTGQHGGCAATTKLTKKPAKYADNQKPLAAHGEPPGANVANSNAVYVADNSAHKAS